MNIASLKYIHEKKNNQKLKEQKNENE